jgi:hypothetical protein
MFENSNVSLDIVLQVGRLIHHDFTDEIKEINAVTTIINESPTAYEKEVSNADYWKDKYLKLLEEYNLLLKQR